MREAASFIARQSGSTEIGILSQLVHAAAVFFHTQMNRSKVASLSELDDHLLADMGLSKDDVRRALDVPFAQDPTLELQRIARRNRGRGWNV